MHLLLTVLIIGAIQLQAPVSEGAPVGSRTLESSSINSYFQRSTLQRILVDAIFNVTDNFYLIKRAFQPQPGVHKICINVSYDITCDDQLGDHDQDCIPINCTTGYNTSIIWTEFDTTDAAGDILYRFASNGFSVLGFDWAGACDVESSVITLELTAPSLPCNGSDTDQTQLQQALLYITTLMPHYAMLSNTPSNYDDIVTGYAVEGLDLTDGNLDTTFIMYMIVVAASQFIVFGLSIPLHVTISESIESTTKGKPKLYYYFWSTILLIAVGVWGYEIIYHVHSTRSVVYIVPLILTTTIGLFGVSSILSLAAGRKVELFFAPLSGCRCCSNWCRGIWSYFMTAVGMYFIIVLIAYLLYATPTIVLVYYLYPTRTLIRIPFIIGAVFYSIALLSLVLYQFEKVTKMICYDCIFCKSSEDSTRPLIEIHNKNSYGDQSNEENDVEARHPSCFEHVKKQHRYSNEYYAAKLKEDLQIVGADNHCLHEIIEIAQLAAGIILLVAFVYGEIILANLVFKQTNNTDINSLLALLPTVVFSVFAWFGRSLIFDVKEDIKELSIPYFKKIESTEEKILNAINKLVELQKSRIEHESQNRTYFRAEATVAGERDHEGQRRNSDSMSIAEDGV